MDFNSKLKKIIPLLFTLLIFYIFIFLFFPPKTESSKMTKRDREMANPIYYPTVVFSNTNMLNLMSSLFKQDRATVTSHYDPDLNGWEARYFSMRDIKLGRIPKEYVWPKNMERFKYTKKKKQFSQKIAALNNLPKPGMYKPDSRASFDNYMPDFRVAGATACTEPTTPPPIVPPGVSIELSAGHWHLFTISADGVTKNYLGIDGTCPRWNPAATEILYNHNVVITPTGVFLRNLGTTGSPFHSRISMDGTKVLYLQTTVGSCCDGRPYGNIWVINYNGTGGNTQLTSSGTDTQPFWSPDGTEIAFDRAGNIWKMNANGSSQTQLTSSGADCRPRWSPNSQLLTFWSTRDGGAAEVYKMNRDGSGQTRLTTDIATDYRCRFIGTGSKIAFLSNRNGGSYYDIYTINIDGSNELQLTSGGTTYWGTRWSEEAQKYFYEKATGGWDIYTCNADGTGETNICNTAFQELDFKWSGRADFM